MTDTTNKDLIERAKEALEGATPRPWVVEAPDRWGNIDVVTVDDWVVCEKASHDAHLIALAPDLARLAVAAGELAEVMQEYSKHTDWFPQKAYHALTRFRAISEGEE